VALVVVVGLAKVLTPTLEHGLARLNAPEAVVGIAIAALVLLPEGLAALLGGLLPLLIIGLSLIRGFRQQDRKRALTQETLSLTFMAVAALFIIHMLSLPPLPVADPGKILQDEDRHAFCSSQVLRNAMVDVAAEPLLPARHRVQPLSRRGSAFCLQRFPVMKIPSLCRTNYIARELPAVRGYHQMMQPAIDSENASALNDFRRFELEHELDEKTFLRSSVRKSSA
jgi:hypothetical protein